MFNSNEVNPLPLSEARFLFRPVILESQKNASEILSLKEQPDVLVLDTIEKQLVELYKLRNPSNPDKTKIRAQVQEEFNSDYSKLGLWVYYPWKKTLIHTVSKAEFIEIRTNRNKLKITDEEQEQLSSKVVGVVGLSVGNSVALTIAMERLAGKIILADFDELEVSNLNRLRASLCDLDLPKTVIAAQQIAEIDPFIEVELFNEGLTDQNMQSFLSGTSKLDLLVEVCDSIQLKYQVRKKARELQIPVVMDTNDRGLVDIELFNVEPNRPIFHGLVDEAEFDKIDELPLDERMKLISKIVGGDAISDRLKLSMPQIGKTLTSYPQLASGVMLGGAVTAYLCRKILLKDDTPSGRFYVDFDEIFK